MSLQRDSQGEETRQIHQLVDFSGRRVLEIGCGDGRLTWRYAQAAARVVGLDLKADLLQTAPSERDPGLVNQVSFIQADSLALPFGAESFDIALLAWSF